MDCRSDKPDEIIHICMGIYDGTGDYCRYAAVAIRSVIINTESRLVFHIICDDTVGSEKREKFQKLAGMHEIIFYEVNIPDKWKKLRIKNLGTVTIGTLFRLCIPKVLPEYVQKIVYIDCDVIVNIDIAELWDAEYDGNLLLGRKDIHTGKVISNDEERYVNAGVLCMDLEGIRQKHDLLEEAFSFFLAHPECVYADQDALNSIFEGEIGLLDSRFNKFTKYSRDKVKGTLERDIYHYAGDKMRFNPNDVFDRTFFRILRDTPWGDEDQADEYFLNKIQKEIRQMSLIRRIMYKIGCKKEIVFWGAKRTRLFDALMEEIDFGCKDVKFVDRNTQLRVKGFPKDSVYGIEHLRTCKEDKYVVVLAFNYYSEIKSQLLEMGYEEIEQFADIRMLFDDCE